LSDLLTAPNIAVSSAPPVVSTLEQLSPEAAAGLRTVQALFPASIIQAQQNYLTLQASAANPVFLQASAAQAAQQASAAQVVQQASAANASAAQLALKASASSEGFLQASAAQVAQQASAAQAAQRASAAQASAASVWAANHVTMNLVKISYDGKNKTLMGLDASGNTFYANTNITTSPNWTLIPGSFTSISHGNGQAFATNAIGEVFYALDYRFGKWIKIPGTLNQINFDFTNNVLTGVGGVGSGAVSVFYADTNITTNPNWTTVMCSMCSINPLAFTPSKAYAMKGGVFFVSTMNYPLYIADYKNPVLGYWPSQNFYWSASYDNVQNVFVGGNSARPRSAPSTTPPIVPTTTITTVPFSSIKTEIVPGGAVVGFTPNNIDNTLYSNGVDLAASNGNMFVVLNDGSIYYISAYNTGTPSAAVGGGVATPTLVSSPALTLQEAAAAQAVQAQVAASQAAQVKATASAATQLATLQASSAEAARITWNQNVSAARAVEEQAYIAQQELKASAADQRASAAQQVIQASAAQQALKASAAVEQAALQASAAHSANEASAARVAQQEAAQQASAASLLLQQASAAEQGYASQKASAAEYAIRASAADQQAVLQASAANEQAFQEASLQASAANIFYQQALMASAVSHDAQIASVKPDQSLIEALAAPFTSLTTPVSGPTVSVDPIAFSGPTISLNSTTEVPGQIAEQVAAAQMAALQASAASKEVSLASRRTS